MLTATDKAAYLIDEAVDPSSALLGGKGAGLVLMHQLGIPVPPALVITTEAGRAYFNAKREVSRALKHEITEAINKLVEQSGATFGDANNPLLVSVRSGAPISMPGQMSTILNVGLTREAAEAMPDKALAGALYVRLYKMLAGALGVDKQALEDLEQTHLATNKVERLELLNLTQAENFVAEAKALISDHLGQPFPEDPESQLWLAIRAVWDSWDTPTMRDYRRTLGVSDDMSTAVVIQRMALGNVDEHSGTGVAYSRNPLTGEDVVGSFLFQAQGEEVVSGERTTHGLNALQREFPNLYDELLAYVSRLEDHYEYPVEIEFTIENGKLYLLQVRKAVLSDRAIIQYVVDLERSGKITEEEAVERIKPSLIERLHLPVFSPTAKEQAYKEGRLLTRGLPASPGVGIGVAVTGVNLPEGKNVVLVRHALDPKEHSLFARSKAIISASSSVGSHGALMANVLKKPCVVGCEEITDIAPSHESFTINGHELRDGAILSIDGSSGEIFEGEIEVEQPEPFEALRIFEQWWQTYNGTERNANPLDGRPHSPWANATYSTDPQEIETFRQRARALLAEHNWSTDKARGIQIMHLIPEESRIKMIVCDGQDEQRIRELMYDAVDQGYWTGPRTAMGPGNEGASPWQSGIKTREQVDAFFDDPSFQGVKKAFAAGYKSWMNPRPEDGWSTAPAQIIVTYDQPGKGVESLEHEHFACSVIFHSNPDEVSIYINLGSMQTRAFETIPPEQLICVTMAINPSMPYMRGQRTMVFGEKYWDRTALPHVAAEVGVGGQEEAEIVQHIKNLMLEGKLSPTILTRLVQKRDYMVAKHIETKVFDEWWLPPFQLPFLMRALDEVYSLQVLEPQGRADADGNLIWCKVYDAKGREEKRTAVGQ